MRPLDSLPRDYSLYYSDTWMRVGKDIMHIHATVGGDLKGKLRTDRNFKRIDPAHADIWFPRAGAYNGLGGALYIGRAARRNMKKSANYEHYFIVWGLKLGPIDMMWTLAAGPNLLRWTSAKDALDNKAMSSVAISPTIIISQAVDEGYPVIFRGTMVGTLIGKKFVPHVEDHPMNDTFIDELREGGIECR